ncbi:MAG: 50S ribosomal protein L30 [Candidatus Lokiarchaeota archaeon]|nr:50S ribosomal protein L30 [Candidatus Lokiarchaeota archaeon]MBD3338312.1 50S ribosomal protein L30 [Candidatus Lokiarchaeota archaeon]
MAKKKSKGKEAEEDAPKLYFAVRIRGSPGMKRKIMDTLSMLRMNKVNHGVLIWGEKSYMGMLRKCKDYIAYGEIDPTTLVRLLRVRGRIEGNKPLTDEHLNNLTDYKTIKDLAKALHEGKIQYKEKFIFKIKPVFRLHPPRKGHRKSIKKYYGEGGTLGNVGVYINELIHKML